MMYQIQSQNNGDPRIASTRKEVHRSFVIRPCTLSKISEDSLEKKKMSSIKSRFVPVDFFFHKEAYNSIAVPIFTINIIIINIIINIIIIIIIIIIISSSYYYYYSDI